MKQTDLDPEDARAIGWAFMEAIPEDSHWDQSPIEIFHRLQDRVEELRKALADQVLMPSFNWHDFDQPRHDGWTCQLCGVVSQWPVDHLEECELFDPKAALSESGGLR